MQTFIQASGICKEYHKGQSGVMALHGVSFSAQAGEFLSIVGRSGSGKSTLLNILGGLDTASAGKIYVDSQDLAVMRRYQLALYRRTMVGMIFQSFNLIPSCSALDNVALPMTFAARSKSERTQRAKDLLALVGLAQREHHKPSELSGGEAQRVAIARALANQPRLLLADEPTGNLDSHTAGEILELLLKLNAERNLTIVMVTHDVVSAADLSHRVLRMLDGRIVEEEEFRRMA